MSNLSSTVPLSSKLGAVRLKPGRDKKIRGHYPWVQREEVADADAKSGDLVRLLDAKGDFLAIGTYDSTSRFPVRVLSLADEAIDEDFFEKKFRAAQSLRHPKEWQTNAYRALFAEADGVPGLIVDDYDRNLAVQVRSLGMEHLKSAWLPALSRVFSPESIYERSDMAGRKEESLQPHSGPLIGETPDRVLISERGIQFSVPIKGGLKTGHYLDQRENRRKLEERVRSGDRVLDLFCYTGGFCLSAAHGGAFARGVDILTDTIEIAKENASLNKLDADFQIGNAFEFLEAESAEKWDWIIIDPPAISKAKENRDSLKWAIWKLVFNAIPKLNPGARMLVCSCSYQMSFGELTESVRLAANDRGVRLAVEDVSLQPPDHPYLLQFPESLYLKCLWLKVV